jgi:hypothetical protein
MASALEKHSGISTREPFNRESSGLVDLSCYRPYLVDPPDQVPVRFPATDGSVFVHQHVYFTEPQYRQLDLPREERDSRLSALRNSPYNQVAMRRLRERQLHLDKEPFVDPPPIDNIDKALKDYADIDLVGAASLGIRLTMRGKHINTWSLNFDPPELQALSRHDRIDIFKAEREKALSSLSPPRIVPDILVASALKRMATRLKDRTLDRIANERLIDEYYYPLRVPKRGHLRNIGNLVLKDALGIQALQETRMVA